MDYKEQDTGQLLKKIRRAIQVGSNKDNRQVPEAELKDQTEYVPGGTFKVLDEISPDKDKALGLWTAGASTCTVVAGFFIAKEGKYGLFLSHVMPNHGIGGIFYKLPITKIDNLYYTVIYGPALPAAKSISNELSEVKAWLGRKGINVNGLPEKSRREATHTSHPIFYKKGLDASVDVIVKLEEEKGTYSPKITTIWNK